MSLENPLSNRPLPLIPGQANIPAQAKSTTWKNASVQVGAPAIAVKTTARQVFREKAQPLPEPIAPIGSHKTEVLKEKTPVNKEALQSAKEKCARAGARLQVLFKGAGKGAKPMAENYWAELVHSKHGYGREINKMFKEWKDSDSTQPFDDWMKTRETSLKNKVTYLDAEQRKEYAATIESGRISTPHEGGRLTTVNNMHIFVVSPDNKIYVGIYDRGKFNHSSFLSGAAVQSAGELTVQDGKITTITDKSGHYETNRVMVLKGITALLASGADLKGTTLVLNAHPESRKPQIRHEALRFLAENIGVEHIREVSTEDSKEFATKELKDGQFTLRLSSDKTSIVVVKKSKDKITQTKVAAPFDLNTLIEKSGGRKNLVPYYTPQKEVKPTEVKQAQVKEAVTPKPNLLVGDTKDSLKFAETLSSGQFTLRLSSDGNNIVVVKKKDESIEQIKYPLESDIDTLIKKFGGRDKYRPFSK